jgi:hypothetical protein
MLNLLGLACLLFLSLSGWWVVARVWRYGGPRVSDVMPHNGFSDEDKLGYARTVLSATIMVTLSSVLLGGIVLKDFLASRGVDRDLTVLLQIVMGLMGLAAVFVVLTLHFHWPRILIPPAFRERPDEPRP